MLKLPSRCALLACMPCFTSSNSSFSASPQALAWLLSGPRGPPLRALQAALSCRMRVGSSRASDRPPHVTGGILRGPQTGERGASSGQTPTSTPTPRPESRILRSGPQSPSSTGMLETKENRWMADRCTERKDQSKDGGETQGRQRRVVLKKRVGEEKRDGGGRSSLSGSHQWGRGGHTVATVDVGQRNKDCRERQDQYQVGQRDREKWVRSEKKGKRNARKGRRQKSEKRSQNPSPSLSPTVGHWRSALPSCRILSLLHSLTRACVL